MKTKLNNPYTETLLANFAGKVTTWAEIKSRCGFSDNEVWLALYSLQQHGLLDGDGQCGSPIEIKSPSGLDNPPE